MKRPLLTYFPTADPVELDFVDRETMYLDDHEFQQFVTRYHAKRQSPANVLIFAAIGFAGVAGIHRFVMGQIGMGILYLLTFGFCFIGTIIDMVNHRQLADEFNRKAAMETVDLIQYYD